MPPTPDSLANVDAALGSSAPPDSPLARATLLSDEILSRLRTSAMARTPAQLSRLTGTPLRAVETALAALKAAGKVNEHAAMRFTADAWSNL